MESQFDKDEIVIEQLKSSAAIKAKVMTLLASSVVIGQFSLITLGSFHYLSWDIMEPVSYLMMLGNFTCGFGFYTLMKRDLDLESVTDILVYRMTERAARRRGIDYGKHEAVRQ